MKPHWGMLADDLTGACDAGVAFAMAGLRTSVVWREDAAWPADAELLVVSTETRASTPDEAQDKVLRVSRRWERPILYKKIDSVLRGPIAAEIEALIQAGGFERAVVCPALPEQGRVVRGGQVFVHGEPLATPAGIELTDAESPEALRELAVRLLQEQGRSLAAGSAGLALALAAELGHVTSKPPPLVRGPVALVIGSHHPASLAQIDFLRDARAMLETTPARLETAQTDTFCAVVMREVDERAFEPLGRAMRQRRIAGLIVTGGASARVVLDGMGADGIELCGELERGIPWGRVRGGLADGALLVTKSGGFGGPDCLWKAWRTLRPETTR